MLKVRVRLSVVLILVSLMSACGLQDSKKTTKISQIAMGTLVEISAVGAPDKTKPAIYAAFQEIKRVEDLTSFHKSSGLTELNRSGGEGAMKSDPELVELLKKSLVFSELSGGAFDATVGPLAQLWNFSGVSGPRLPDSQEVTQTLPLIGWKKLEVDADKNTISLPSKGMAVDLGAIAKGYALDRAADKIRSFGIESALINAGGDIVAFGTREPGKPWRIGIQDPRNPSGIIAVAEINDRAVVTSGDYERFFMEGDKRYHHILDPQTGYPAQGVQSVTIVAPDGVTADALSTAVFVLGKRKGLDLVEAMPDVACLIVDSEGMVVMSEKARNIFQTKP